jgi:ComF family protein
MLPSFQTRFSVVMSAIADVLAPRHCLLCEQSLQKNTLSHFACQRCMDALPPAPRSDELLAGVAQHFPKDNLALHRITARFQLGEEIEQHPPVASIQALIYGLKYGNKPSIGAELGRELGEFFAHQAFLGNTLLDYDALVPVPLHPARVRERGYNQAELLAKGIEHILKVPVRSTYLRRIRYTRSQTLLSAKERASNLQNVMVGGKERESIKNMRILLVDDILTTGATLNSCALALLECGARRVDAVVVAKA